MLNYILVLFQNIINGIQNTEYQIKDYVKESQIESNNNLNRNNNLYFVKPKLLYKIQQIIKNCVYYHNWKDSPKNFREKFSCKIIIKEPIVILENLICLRLSLKGSCEQFPRQFYSSYSLYCCFGVLISTNRTIKIEFNNYVKLNSEKIKSFEMSDLDFKIEIPKGKWNKFAILVQNNRKSSDKTFSVMFYRIENYILRYYCPYDIDYIISQINNGD
ncbi:hypothetical protein NUSPORA_00529 [Nucleospora cyclopteri]